MWGNERPWHREAQRVPWTPRWSWTLGHTGLQQVEAAGLHCGREEGTSENARPRWDLGPRDSARAGGQGSNPVAGACAQRGNLAQRCTGRPREDAGAEEPTRERGGLRGLPQPRGLAVSSLLLCFASLCGMLYE